MGPPASQMVWSQYIFWEKKFTKQGYNGLPNRKGTEKYTYQLQKRRKDISKMIHVLYIRVFKWPRNQQT